MFNNLSKKVLYPNKYLLPSIRMSPFNGKMEVPDKDNNFDNECSLIKAVSDTLFNRELPGRLTFSGKDSISQALRHIVKNKNFCISIITSSSSDYVSSCVTETISNYCKFVKGYKPDADAFFFIHEFGRSVKIPKEIIFSGKPIIEDCAYYFVDHAFNRKNRTLGDFIIFSLPKAFPVQYGGLLFYNDVKRKINVVREKPDHYILYNLSRQILNIKVQNGKRLENYKLMQKTAQRFKLTEYFKTENKDIPHAFLIKLDNSVNKEKIKNYMNEIGVESSIFYGSSAYFIPCHQNLNAWEIEYMFYHMASATKKFKLYRDDDA